MGGGGRRTQNSNADPPLRCHEKKVDLDHGISQQRKKLNIKLTPLMTQINFKSDLTVFGRDR